MIEEKLRKYELVGGLLVLILGVTNILQFILVGTADWKAVALFSIYGFLFLIGGGIFFVVRMKEMLKSKKALISISSVLLLMNPISNSIYIFESGGLDLIPLSLSIINLILCLITLPVTFIGYADLEEMDTREKISYVSLILIRGSGFFHILQPVLYGVSVETMGMLIFGIIYFLIGFILLRRKDARSLQLIGFIIPIVGAVLGIGLLFMSPTPYVPVFIIFDLIISPIRLYYIKTQPAE